MKHSLRLFAFLLFAASAAALARVPYPVDPTYEDTVRIVILWNNPDGLCPPPAVGRQTMEFVVQSLDTTYVHQVKILRTATATLAMAQNLWPGRLPHVIVHINAGWGSNNGQNDASILNWAVQNYIGVVEIGDDAAWLAQTVFGMNLVSNFADGMGSAMWLDKANDSLWIGVTPSRDQFVDSTKYPFANGVVRNMTRILGVPKAYFKPVQNPSGAAGRCEADPDDFSLQPGIANKVAFLGYQQGYNATSDGSDESPRGVVGAVDRYTSITVFQDTMSFQGRIVIRRAVSLSLEPQYLVNATAAQQLVYDAIMFASLTHTLEPVRISIRANADTITAGLFAQLSADILPVDLPQETKNRFASNVSWSLLASQTRPGDQLTAATGAVSQVTATRAFRQVAVVAALYDSAFKTYVYDTAWIYVKPGPPDHITIENDSTPDLWTPDNLTRIYINADTNNSREAYAFYRDAYNNLCDTALFKGRAANAGWTSDKTASIGVTSPVRSQKWISYASRGPSAAGSDSAWVIASEPAMPVGYPNVKPDSVKVVLINFYFTKFRVVLKGTNIPVDSIGMTTDETRDLEVQGQPSNAAGTWMTVSNANWRLTAGPAVAIPVPPGDAQEWTFSPTAPTAPLTSKLIVWDPDESRTVPDTVPIYITRAAPSRVEFELADTAYRAGQPFRTVVRIYNTDGLVPGTWCYPGQGSGNDIYQDIIMRPDQAPAMANAVEGFGAVNLRPAEAAKVSAQCFANGIDTTYMTLYYVPSNPDSLHQLWVRMAGATGMIEASTARFPLSPGIVDSIVLTDQNGTPLPATKPLNAPTDKMIVMAQGYDAWGNPLGPVIANWSVGGNLHQPFPTTGTFIIYATDSVLYPEAGCLKASAAVHPPAADSVCLTITAPPANYTAVISQDTSGNGYLDRLEVHFNKLVTLTDADIASIDIAYQKGLISADFTITNIRPAGGNAQDSVYYIVLQENRRDSLVPQTAWLPTIMINGVNGITGDPSNPDVLIDGAPPVVWSVIEEIKGGIATVTVNFSEEILHYDGSSFNSASDSLSRIINVWRQNSDGSFTLDPTALDSATIKLITSVSTNEKDIISGNVRRTQIVFALPDTLRLENYHYLNIVTITDPSIIRLQTVDNINKFIDPNAALKGNVPQPYNVKRKTIVLQKEMIASQGPNPFPPSIAYQEPVLLLHDQQTIAERVVLQHIGGTIISVEITPQTTASLGQLTVVNIQAQLKVYDIAGNLVYHRDNDNLLAAGNEWSAKPSNQNWKSGESKTIAFWWGGLVDPDPNADIGEQPRKCAPGVYRGIIYLTLVVNNGRQNYAQKQKPVFVNMGVRK